MYPNKGFIAELCRRTRSTSLPTGDIRWILWKMSFDIHSNSTRKLCITMTGFILFTVCRVCLKHLCNTERGKSPLLGLPLSWMWCGSSTFPKRKNSVYVHCTKTSNMRGTSQAPFLPVTRVGHTILYTVVRPHNVDCTVYMYILMFFRNIDPFTHNTSRCYSWLHLAFLRFLSLCPRNRTMKLHFISDVC